MKYVKPGKTGPLVSTVGFGAWGISGRDWGSFCISHPACHTVIPGAKNPAQVEENVKASDLENISYEDFFPKN
jgi:aryl-alcohol dehydrogenase-like predicted oxidoreductase